MPHIALTEKEVLDITAFLASLKNADSKVKEPQPSPRQSEAGKNLVESVGCLACHNSKTGSALEGLGSKWLPGQLAEFLMDPRSVDRSGRMPSMLNNKQESVAIAQHLTSSHNAAYENAGDAKDKNNKKKPTAINGDVGTGKALVQSKGCVSCHAVDIKGTALLNTPTQPPVNLEKLSAMDGGCLAEKPAGKAVNYHLNADQRSAITAFIGSIKSSAYASVAPAFEFYHRTKTLGCVNCHELDHSIPADAGDRVPLLTNVGGKLRKEWIGQVLTSKQRVRPWLKKRMPEFAGNAVADLPACAVAAAGVGDAPELVSPSRDEIIVGQKLLGSGAGGLGCITCHGFAGAKPNVIDDTRGPDITTAAARLRPDHFKRWVADPKRVYPSTPMPSFFDGQSQKETAEKVDAMFRYVSAGENMPPPVGWVDTNNYVLAVHDVPMMLRTFMPNLAGGTKIPRGIAVGLPGLLNYCFDADTCTVRYVWSGAFLDMQPYWQGRGGNVIRVLGKPFYASNLLSVQIGEGKSNAEAQFTGYEIENGLPIFSYTVNGVAVKHKIAQIENASGFKQTFEIDSGKDPVGFIVPDSKDVIVSSDVGEFKSATVEQVVVQRLSLPAGKIKVTISVVQKSAK